MKILITGHKGFVGTAFCKKLSVEPNVLDGVDILAGVDARDFFRKNDTKYDLVIHLAAVVGGRLTIDNDPLKVAVDLSIDAEMFQWAVRTKQPRVVYYSSSAAYPIDLQTSTRLKDLHENDINFEAIRNPDMTYGWAKLTGEYQAKFAEAEGVRVHVFRPFSGYGETQSLDYPFPSFIARGKRRDDPFEVWGNGMQYRDFIHIDDIVDATLEAVKQDVPGPVNLGLGRPTSFNELAEMVMSQAGYKGEIKHLPAKPTGVHFRVSDPDKMFKFFTPKITLEEGIARALA